MKNRGVDSINDLIIGGAGGCSLALAATAGWKANAPSSMDILNVHSAILVILSLGLFVASFAIRRAAARVSMLEDEVASLRRKAQ